jgi:hypothetical protein
MDVGLLRMFQRQGLLQCQFAIVAANDVNSALVRNDIIGIFGSLQSLLTAAANIAKVFWGSGGKFSETRKSLRTSIGLSDDSPLRTVTMRNNYEHFDERLERWSEISTRKNYLDLSLMPVNAVHGSDAIRGLDDIDKFRTYDPATGVLTFWSEEFHILALIKEIEQIFSILKAESYKPPRPSTLQS